jgi:DNA-binding response OmpR family regulator
MRYSVVVIEDDEAIRWLIRKVLEKEYDVHTFGNVGNAMKHMNKIGLPDLIMTDIKLPVIDGKDFLINLKKSGLYGNIPVIVISSWSDLQTKTECLKAGADDYISKPFNPEQLLSTVQDVISTNIGLMSS